ncbi:MAG: HAD-IC family P-type ATPase, partial [Actinomycetia bacterium]|nr:HAD-IC family P-type ATPase [Actinomycetes bacterium]
MDYYLQSSDAALTALGSGLSGLSAATAAERLVANGPNELTKARQKSLVQRLLAQLINPMILILLAAAAVSVGIAVWEQGGFSDFAEAGIILTVVIINSILGVVQESKAEKAIEALQEMSAATARVRREGQVSIIAARDLVCGDIVLLEAGDAVPADLRILSTTSLKIEEAALTGESVPISKQVAALAALDSGNVPLGDRKNMAYLGSVVVYGRGEALVTAVGMSTEMGKIAHLIQTAEVGETPLQKRL